MSKNIAGVSVALKTNIWLTPVLETFHNNIYKYIDTVGCKNDLPYFYNERTTVSLLAGAAWNSGFVCLQDYATQKNDPSRKGPSKKFGYGDLYIRSINEKKEASFETKQIFPNINYTKTSVTDSKQFISGINKAQIDATQIRDTKNKFSVLFVTPRFPKERWCDDYDNIMNKIDSIVDEGHQYANDSKTDIFTWCFPHTSSVNSFFSRAKNGKEFYCAGVMSFFQKIII